MLWPSEAPRWPRLTADVFSGAEVATATAMNVVVAEVADFSKESSSPCLQAEAFGSCQQASTGALANTDDADD